jgi:hypothetical protein
MKYIILSLIYFLLKEKNNYCEFSVPTIFFLLHFNIKQKIIKNGISHLQMGKDGVA